ncbi:alkaline phosphatase family protein [Bifidobacterium longum]|uniref:alkaline phosphatase family protein n=1 Tax=Bifidobacterium longum TaxID=216816 RepID=UPI0021197F3D|nr:alkaline phosphatase family protein [Bifidobacterium longum]
MQQKLLLIGVDGVRLDIVRKENHAPNINRILNNGSSAEMTMEVPTISRPGWSSILTGTTHAQHGVQDNTFRGNRLYECPDFLTRAAVAHPMMKTVAASSWPPLVDPAGPGPVIATRNDQIISCHHRLVVRDGETYGYRLADSEIARFAVISISNDPADASFIYLGEARCLFRSATPLLVL